MSRWCIVDNRTDKNLLTVEADSEGEAEQRGFEYVAESGRDREIDYDGFYVTGDAVMRGDEQ